MSLSRYFPNGEPRISTIPSESNINSSRFGVKCTTPWGSHRLWHYSWVCLFPGAGLNPHPGCFKAIKKPACSEFATFLFCFFIYLGLLATLVNPRGAASKQSKSQIIYYLGLLANAREPWGGRFKAIEKLDYLLFRGLYAKAYEPKGGALQSHQKASLLRSRNLSFLLFYLLGIMR